ncbi:MAG: alginate lyase family protein [Planctomycetota bacterium]
MNPLTKAYYILRYLGPRLVWLRAGVYLAKASGRTRRIFGKRPWEQIDLADILRPEIPAGVEEYAEFKHANPPTFLFPLGQPPIVPESWSETSNGRQPVLAERIELLGRDRCVYFFHKPSPEPIDWYHNPFDDKRGVANRTWCEIPDYRPEQGDPRMMWEPARAAWALDLARGRGHGLDADVGPLLWRWVDSWMRACPPFEGFHWKCGQESTVRLIAITLAFWSLADDAATTPARWRQFARLAWATGYRVARHIDYAISQKNNHAISEACGLMLIGQLLPELRDSQTWWQRGREVLEYEIRRQVYADGSYVQHSMNYERVMLSGAVLGTRLAELHGEPFPRDIYDRLRDCGEFLYQMMEPETGRLPQYGHNDGADVLPLSECDFNDYRPIVQSVYYLATRKRPLPPGPWDEHTLWLFGAEALDSVSEPCTRPQSRAFDDGGYYTLRRDESWAMLRCHTYRDRMGHCDPLHMDVWFRGQNVIQDCGLYKYYIPGRPDLEFYFKSIAAHNTVEIDGVTPLELVSRFLWLPWTRARRRWFETADEECLYFEGEHYDYDRKPWRVLNRRSVLSLKRGVWVVIDDLLGRATHEAVLRWHLLDAPYELEAERPVLVLQTARGPWCLSVASDHDCPAEVRMIRGCDEPGRVQGFAAPYYGTRQPIPTMEVAYRAALPLRVITAMGPDKPVTLRLISQTEERQHWEVATTDAAWGLELAAPTRRCAQTLIQCSSLTNRTKL